MNDIPVMAPYEVGEAPVRDGPLGGARLLETRRFIGVGTDCGGGDCIVTMSPGYG